MDFLSSKSRITRVTLPPDVMMFCGFFLVELVDGRVVFGFARLHKSVVEDLIVVRTLRHSWQEEIGALRGSESGRRPDPVG